MVPKNWSKVGFGEVVSLSKSRHNPKTSNNSYPCIELEHIEQGTGRIIGSTPSSSLNSTKSKFKKGDVIFGKLRPYLRKYAMPSFNGVCSTEIWVFKPSDKILKPYLYHLIQTSHFISEANKSSGSKMPRADWDVISEMVINLPPLPEQQKIAKILTTWDKAIDTTERLIDNSKQQKKALMQQLLTGKKRLLDENGKPFDNEWEEVQLSEIGKCIAGLTYSPSDVVEDSGLLVLRSSNIQNGILSFEDNVYVRPDVKLKSKTKENDILICVRNGSKNLIGKSALIKGRAINQAHGAFMTIYRSKYPHYVFHLFQSDLYYRQVKRNLGATINSINTGDLNKFKFYMPSDSKEIKKIAAVLTNADKEIELLEQQLADLQQEKKALMQQLLTGKKRVLV